MQWSQIEPEIRLSTRPISRRGENESNAHIQHVRAITFFTALCSHRQRQAAAALSPQCLQPCNHTGERASKQAGSQFKWQLWLPLLLFQFHLPGWLGKTAWQRLRERRTEAAQFGSREEYFWSTLCIYHAVNAPVLLCAVKTKGRSKVLIPWPELCSFRSPFSQPLSRCFAHGKDSRPHARQGTWSRLFSCVLGGFKTKIWITLNANCGKLDRIGNHLISSQRHQIREWGRGTGGKRAKCHAIL